MTSCEKYLRSIDAVGGRCDCQDDPKFLHHCVGCNGIVECFPEDLGPDGVWCSDCWKVEKLERLFVAERVAHFFSMLAAVGYTVVTGLKMVEYKEEARRCRHIVRGMMDGLDTNGAVVEYYWDEKANVALGVVICAPRLNEHNLGQAMTVVMEDFWAHMGGKPEGAVLKPRVTGTENGG